MNPFEGRKSNPFEGMPPGSVVRVDDPGDVCFEKPPLGIAPRYLWTEQRARELIFALERVAQVPGPLTEHWSLTERIMSELGEHLKWLHDHKFTHGVPESGR
jgi:hypothetical protein